MSSPFYAFKSDDKDTSKSTPTLFGSTTMTSPTPSASIFGSSDKPGSVFGSGSPPKHNAFGFGKPGGSIGNPVGFGFGGPSSKAGDSSMTLGSSEPSTGFSFGAQPARSAESPFSPPATVNSAESTPQPEVEGNGDGGEVEPVKLLPTSTHDGEGEGEEDEETTHVVKCKVFRLFKTDDKNEWKDLGVGMFRLKKHKETDARRVLMRNSSTGRILINFRVYAGLRPTLAKTLISFVGYEDSTPTSFRVRVKTENQASELKQALDREVAALQTTE
jgi:nucleoporin NUP2